MAAAAAIAWLKQYVTGGRDRAAATRIAVDALSRGVARAALHTESSALVLALSPNARTLVTGGEGKRIQVWNLPEAKLRAALDFPGLAVLAEYSSDGNRFAFGSEDGSVVVWTTASLTRTELRGNHAALRGMSFSPDGRSLLTLDGNGEARLWDLATSTSQAMATNSPGARRANVGFLRDGSAVMLVPRGSSVDVVSVSDKRLRRTIENGAPVSWVVAATEANTVVAVNDKGLRAWSLDSGALLGSTLVSKDAISIRLSPDGKQVVYWCEDLSVVLWNVHDGSIRLGHTRERIYNAAFSDDGDLVSFGSNGGPITLWDLKADSMQRLLGHTDVVSNFVFANDGRFLVSTGDDDYTVRVWPISRVTERILRGHASEVIDVSFAPDGNQLATASTDGVRLWNWPSGSQRHLADGSLTTQDISFSPDGRRLAWSRWDGTARWLDVSSNQGGVLAHGSAVAHVQWLADGQTLATAAADGTISLWSVLDGSRVVIGKHKGDVNMLALSPNKQQLLSCGEDGTVRVWQLDSKQMRIIDRRASVVDRAYFLPDGRAVVSAGHDGTIRLVDLTTGGTQEQHVDGVEWRSLAVSPTGESIAAGSQDGRVVLWNPAQPEGLHYLYGHTGVVRNLAFSPDGHLLASTGFDHTVRLWRPSRNEAAILRGHEGAVIALAFSPDGNLLATTSSDTTTRLWRVDAVGFTSAIFLSESLSAASTVPAATPGPDSYSVAIKERP